MKNETYGQEEKHENQKEIHGPQEKHETPNESPAEGSGSLFTFLAIGALGRFLSNKVLHIPGVEPIIPITVIATMKLGPTSGAVVGILSYVISDFLAFGTGSWTIGYAIAALVAVMITSYYKEFSENNAMLAAFFASLVFPFIIDFISGEWPNIEHLINSFVFIGNLIHIITNVAFAGLFAQIFKK